MRLNEEARYALRTAGMSQTAWIRKYCGDGARIWLGDACGCPDDRCIGYHHDETDECQCLPSLLNNMAREGAAT